MKLNPFSTEAIALQERPPALMARMVSIAICAIAACTLVYACVASMDVVITAQGRVIPSGKSKVVQPLEAGVVRAIHVKDGQQVKAGEVLVELDTTTTAADRDRLQRELWEAEADVARVAATLSGRPTLALGGQVPREIAANQQSMLASRIAEHGSRTASLQADIARRQAERETVAATISQLRLSLPLVKKKFEMREDLARTGHITEAGLIESRLELINQEKELSVQESRLKEAEAGLNAARQQLAQAEAEFRSRTNGELMEVTKRREGANQELIKASQRRELQILRSPIDGVVQQLAVATIGGVVTQAQPLMTIVPENAPLEVEAQVMNRDIGHVKVGQRVINKVETFDFTRYGYIEGTVLWAGTDAVNDPRLGPVYPVRIKLNASETPSTVNGRKGTVTAGMNVTSDVRTDERRLISYFLAPLLRYRQEALRER
jgi:hemolysin D